MGWLRRVFRMTEREYRANIEGLNIFFGAVLGFVLAGSENLAMLPFAGLLLIVAGTVISILYISSSDKRVTYALLTVMLVAVLPRVMGNLLGHGTPMPPKVQPTLAVWAAMTILIEFLPRDRGEPPRPPVID